MINILIIIKCDVCISVFGNIFGNVTTWGDNCFKTEIFFTQFWSIQFHYVDFNQTLIEQTWHSVKGTEVGLQSFKRKFIDEK